MRSKIITGVLTLLSLFLVVWIIRNGTRYYYHRDCYSSGGKWQRFGNGCANNCGTSSSDICTDALVESCKCSDSKCRNGIACVNG